ncbi:MAG: hypothetical protein ACOCXA_02780 [Planctomycetota bacterium]
MSLFRLLLASVMASFAMTAETPPFRIERCAGNPIITPESHPDIGSNINGPSVIRVPEWVEDRLAEYYLYFAHHSGRWIRLAVADHPAGPWRVVDDRPLTLDDIAAWGGSGHVASPELLIDDQRQRLGMLFHAPHDSGRTDHATTTPHLRTIHKQATGMAFSDDGLAFTTLNRQVLAFPYLRVFAYEGRYYGISTRGLLFKRPEPGLPDGSMGWIEREVRLAADKGYRHAAVHRRGHTLYYFFSQKGDEPERIKMCTVDLRPDWQDWQCSEPVTVLQPEHDWEGADMPLRPSRGGAIHERVHELRDPAYLADPDHPDIGWLYYSTAGESGIAVARIDWRE